MRNELTSAETALRGTYVAIVKKGLTTFYEVGTALKQLHDRRLYLGTHDNFEDFCRDEFDMTRAYAHRLIAAAKIVDNIKEASPIGDTPPAESIARPLTELPEDEQGEAWQEALDTAPKDEGGAPVVTAKHVEAVVAKKLGKPAPIWREIEKHIDAASNLFGAHAADCDEAWEVKRALEVAVERFSYYVRNVEAT